MDIRFLRIEKNKTGWARCVVELPVNDLLVLKGMADGRPVEIKDVEDFTKYIKYNGAKSHG